MNYKPKSYNFKGPPFEYEWCFKVYPPEKGKYKEFYDSYLRQEERRANKKYFGNYNPFEGKGYTCSGHSNSCIYDSNPNKVILNKHKIFSRKDWKKWILKNHPDKNKNIDSELVANINSAVNIVYPSRKN